MTAVRLNFRLTGPDDAPVVALAGSLGSTRAMWDPQVAALAARFRVLTFDLRGHGASPVPTGPYRIDDLADDLLALLERLDIARVHLAGLSLGGMVAMRFAARHPARVDRLALLCTSALFGPPKGWHDRAARVREQGSSAVAAEVVTRWFTPGYAERNRESVAGWQQMVADTPAEGYAGCCEAIAELDLLPDLAAIRAPTLVIAGAEDPATPPAHGQVIADGVPGARLLVLRGAAHLANVEQAEAVTAALVLHLDPAGVDAATRGMSTRRQVLGDAHVDRAVAATTAFTAPFQEFITRYAWGDVWSRPGLSRHDRSLSTLSLLAALGHEHELRMHVRAALGNGVTPGEICEVFLHVAVYAGVPAANRAFAVAQELFEDLPAE